MKRVHLSDEQIKQAKKLRAAGWTWTRLGQKFGCAWETVRRRIDPEYAEFRKQQINRARGVHRIGDVAPLLRERATRADVRHSAESLMDDVPADTRDLTARMLGDPLPGRSALDQKKGNP